jgi:hypothetical protein
MRALAQSKVLGKAGVAAIVTALAAYPRFAMWPERANSVWLLEIVLIWAAFVLWSFVFGWHEQYTGRKVINFSVSPKLWGWATAAGLLGTGVLLLMVDPQMRLATPKDYPTTLPAWIAMSLFTMAFEPLFLCFAPFAFFMRLFRKPQVAIVLTVLFEVFVLYLKLSQSKALPSALFVAALVVLRIVGGFLSIYLYVQGGALLVWWIVALVELRHLLHLSSST